MKYYTHTLSLTRLFSFVNIRVLFFLFFCFFNVVVSKSAKFCDNLKFVMSLRFYALHKQTTKHTHIESRKRERENFFFSTQEKRHHHRHPKTSSNYNKNICQQHIRILVFCHFFSLLDKIYVHSIFHND